MDRRYAKIVALEISAKTIMDNLESAIVGYNDTNNNSLKESELMSIAFQIIAIANSLFDRADILKKRGLEETAGKMLAEAARRREIIAND